MKIGVLGMFGRVGSYLVNHYPECSGIPIDVTNKDELKDAGLNYFDVIINCSAKTNVDKCQHPANKHTEDYKHAVLVNTRAVEYIRKAFDCRLIHLSTDYVFKCDKGPYFEKAHRDPVNDYGYTKFGGEVVLETAPREHETIVVRTTGLYGSGRDFASFVLDEIKNNRTVIASKELHGNQTYIPHLCDALMRLSRMMNIPKFFYLHIGSKEVISRYDFAVVLANVFELPTEHLFPCRNKEIAGWVAPRPTKGGLRVRAAEKMGVPIYSILDGLKAYKEQLLR